MRGVSGTSCLKLISLQMFFSAYFLFVLFENVEKCATLQRRVSGTLYPSIIALRGGNNSH